MTTNPFGRSGTSDYPVTSPYIGQKTAFKRLRRFLKNEPDSRPQVMLAFGDWGTGKTRLGHQVVAACTGNSPGWHIEEGGKFSEKRLQSEGSDENNILPLWIHLSECESQITIENAARVLVNQGLENLISNDKKGPQTDIRDKLESEGVFRELGNKLETGSISPAKKLVTAFKIIEEKTDIDRVVVIVDEVEEASAIEQTAPDSAETEGVDSRTINALYEGLKEAHNDEGSKYPANFNADFLLLCTDEVEDSIPSGGVERRIEPIHLRHPTVREARQYVNTAADDAGIEELIDDGCVESLFFASFNNFGWFTLAMSNMIYYKQENGNPRYFEVLHNNYDVFTRIFNSNIIDDILAEDDEDDIAQSVVNALFRLRPVSQSSLGISDSDLPRLIDYRTPFEGYQPMASMSVLDIGASRIKRKLQDVGSHSEVGDSDKQVTRIGGETLDANRLEDILEVFSNHDGNIVLYDSESDLAELAEFAFGRGGVKEDAVIELTEVFDELRRNHGEGNEQFVGTSISFLRKWNKRWSKVSSIVQWIDNDDAWERMQSAARDVREETNERILKGLVHTRFNHFENGACEVAPRTDLTSTNQAVDIPNDDFLAVVDSGRAVFLNSDDRTSVREDLGKIQRKEDTYPLVYVLTDSEAEKEDLLPELRDDYPKLAPFINSFTISAEERDDKFYIQMSFLGETVDQGGFSETDIYQNNVEYLQRNHRRPLVQSDEHWKEERQDDGMILEQLVPDRVDIKSLADGIRDWITHRSGDWRTDTDAIDAWDSVNSTEGVRSLIKMPDSNDGSKDRFDLPRFIPKLLSIVEEYGPFQVAGLSGKVLHDVEEGTRIKTSTERTLELLTDLDILQKTSDGYKFVDEDCLLDDIVDNVNIKLPDNLDNAFEDFYYPPSEKTRVDFRIDEESIESKRQHLDQASETVPKIEFSNVTKKNCNPDIWLDQVNKIQNVVGESRRWYQPEDTELDLDDLDNSEFEDLYSAVRSDTDHSEYSIYYRIDLLRQFDNILEDDCDALISEVNDRLVDVDKKYSTVDTNAGEVDFPTDRIQSILEDVKNDLKIEADSVDSILLFSSDEATTNSTIRKHIENQEFAKTFNRTEWYLDQLQDGFWSTYEDAYKDFTVLVENFEDMKGSWDDAISFFSDSTQYTKTLTSAEIPLSSEPLTGIPVEELVSSEHSRDDIEEIWSELVEDSDTNISPDAEVHGLTTVIEDPATNFSGETPSDLHLKIQTLTRKCETINLHKEIVLEIANNELDASINDLNDNWAPLAHAAGRLGEDIGIDKEAYKSENDFKNKYTQIQETREKISDEGKRILDKHHQYGARLWPDFLKAYEVAGNPDRYLSNEVPSTSLEELQELNLIAYQKRYSVSLE